jgi:hypothetical protein
VSKSRECVESRLAARGDGLGGHELLDAVGTLVKGSERFLESSYSPGYAAQNFYSEFQSLNVQFFLMEGKRLVTFCVETAFYDRLLKER